jgi:anti-sigma regulatory factor (Ser/Thr protein kinase)
LLEALDTYVTTTGQGNLSSFAYVLLDPDHATAELAIAGHPPPLLRRPDGSIVLLEEPRGPLLGMAAIGTRLTAHHPVEPGSTLVLYTDGLVERRGESIDVGLARLADVVAAAPPELHPEGLCDLVLQRLGEGKPAPDDVTLLILAFERVATRLRHQFPARLEMLRVIRTEVRSWLGANEVTAAAAADIVLACDEACASAIEHVSSPSGPGLIDLTLEAGVDGVLVSVSDHGEWTDVERAGQERGLQIMTSLMADVEIVSTPGGNTVTMRYREPSST